MDQSINPKIHPQRHCCITFFELVHVHCCNFVYMSSLLSARNKKTNSLTRATSKKFTLYATVPHTCASISSTCCSCTSPSTRACSPVPRPNGQPARIVEQSTLSDGVDFGSAACNASSSTRFKNQSEHVGMGARIVFKNSEYE